jgi:hypothetical protein
MGRAQPTSSPIDTHARRIARAIAKGGPPPLDDDIERYCETSPQEVFAAFAGVARHMPPAGHDETLAFSYLFLLQRLLEQLRYRSDAGYPDAAKLIADFQADVIAQVDAERVDESMLAFVGGALHQSKIAASPALTAAIARRAGDHAAGPDMLDIDAALRSMLDGCGGDPFAAVGMLAEVTHAMPAEDRGTLAAALALSELADARAIAVLLLLDPSAVARRSVAAALARVAHSLTPTEVRRLIAMRNWRPEGERAEVDAIVREARTASVGCARWDAGGVDKLAATMIDGAMSQGLVLVSPAGRKKKRLSSILLKGGIADAWSGEPEPPRRIEATLAEAAAPTLVVSRAYLDRTVAHHLAVGLDVQQAPPIGLLQVAETIGGADWQPARMDFAAVLADLMAEIPTPMREPAAVAALLRRSGGLADLEVLAQPWYEDGPAIAETIARAGGRDRAKLVDYLLAGPLQAQRRKWEEIFLRTALWMREGPPPSDLCWRELAIVAQALADGRDMGEIGLMRDIALRTIAVLRSTQAGGRSAIFP